MSTCMVVAFYEGARDGGQEKKYTDYLNAHKNIYDNVKHSLDAIIFVIACDNLEQERTVVNGNIHYYYRHNRNLSFGSWVDCINSTDYDYYILCEDDYLFIKDNFDTDLLNDYKRCKSDIHVVWRQGPTGPVTGLICTIGIVSKSKVEQILNGYNLTSRHKANAMSAFLSPFPNVSSTKGTVFPYYCYRTDSTWFYVDEGGTCINDYVPSGTDNIIVACYQFVEKYHNHLISDNCK